MIFKDTPENTEFKYFFINKFQWLDPMENEKFQGHPREKSLYRGWFNKDTSSFRLVVDKDLAIYLEKLVISGETGYIANISVVDLNNILDFPIVENDLADLNKWLENDNKDLKEEVFKKVTSFSGSSFSTPDIVAIIKSNFQQSTNNDMQGFMESAEELKELDPMAFDVIWGLIDHLLLEMHEVPEGSIDADWLAKSSKGMAINISASLKCLNRYAGDNRRTNEDPEDLYKAMSHITSEIIRSEINE